MAFYRGGARRVALNLPQGFKFDPTDNEVLFYLKKNILDQHFPANVIPTADVYGTNPDEIPFWEFKDGNGSYWFFFTTKPSGDLVTEDGYWSPIMDAEITDGAKVVGFKRHLVFYQGKMSSGTQTLWNAHEYRVNPRIFTAVELNDGVKNKISNLVVCKIFHMEDDPVTDSDGEI
ncbi:NAC domain-containing 86-like [Olea europaea subsp. europaea]|uniref:NAC domain-containing 86-like n=1 Tax=Olea europaea subsp. europaea TaxID=158383 RepID=A0A8S0PFT4_OLEEU|nr:NAC domain-containing 86-like [Olea europaea subsp. europaea]